MNRKAFGQLIASLRQEFGWTQFQLAEYADLDENTLSNIERGVKRHLEPELLLKLANALNLTSLERREFFLGACGLETRDLIRPPDLIRPASTFDPDQFIADLIQPAARVYTPSYIADVFGNMLAMNAACAELMQLGLDQLKALAHNRQGRLNVLDSINGLISISASFGDGYSDYVLKLLQAYRAIVLRYRSEPRFETLMNEFNDAKDNPHFVRYWRKMATLDSDRVSPDNAFEVEHQKYGKLRFVTSPSAILTPFGEVFIQHYSPLDRETALRFIEMTDAVGTEFTRLSVWP